MRNDRRCRARFARIDGVLGAMAEEWARLAEAVAAMSRAPKIPAAGSHGLPRAVEALNRSLDRLIQLMGDWMREERRRRGEGPIP